jgi:hypothetical protein
MKHIEIKNNFIRDAIKDEKVKLEFTGTKDMVADNFTKLLDKNTFEKHCERLGLWH